MTESFVEALLLEALESVTSRRLARIVLTDAARMRRDAPLPTEAAALLALIQSDLADACYLRLGPSGGRAVSALESRVRGLAAVPVGQWTLENPVRLLFVGERPAQLAGLAEALRSEVVLVRELVELLLGVGDPVRTCVVVDASESPLDARLLASIARDLPRNVVVVVTAASAEFREQFRETGATFRTIFREEPVGAPAVVAAALAAIRGGLPKSRRRDGGGSTTSTQPAFAA